MSSISPSWTNWTECIDKVAVISQDYGRKQRVGGIMISVQWQEELGEAASDDITQPDSQYAQKVVAMKAFHLGKRHVTYIMILLNKGPDSTWSIS